MSLQHVKAQDLRMSDAIAIPGTRLTFKLTGINVDYDNNEVTAYTLFCNPLTVALDDTIYVDRK